MGILGIENRTENWQTAKAFAPFFENPVARRDLAGRLLEPLGGELGEGDVQIELFWRGVRDQMDKDGWTKMGKGEQAEVMAGFASLYNCRFSDLRQEVEKFPNLELPQEWNYRPASADREKFFNNLRYTETDIVLENPKYLFIGEAKHESPFGKDGHHVLVHQLIRQYVAAELLIHHIGSTQRVVPFIVADKDKLGSVLNTAQVKFMVNQHWLKEANILSWDCIKLLADQDKSTGDG